MSWGPSALAHRGGEFDRERNAIQAPTDAATAGALLADNSKSGHTACPLHAHYYLELEEELIGRFFGHDQIAIAEQRLAESENRRAAFDWLVERGEARLALRLATGLRGPTVWGTPGGGRVQEVRGRPGARRNFAAVRGVVPLAAAAWAAVTAGEFTRATELADESIICAQQAGVAPDGFAFNARGLAAFWQGQQTEAIEAMERSVENARAADDGSGQRATQLGAM